MSYDSSKVETDDMFLFVYTTVAADASLDVVAQLTVAGPGVLQESYIDLDPTLDTLFAQHGSRRVPMTEEFLLNYYQYRATFDRALENELVDISFAREEAEDAPSSRVVVPSAFELVPSPSVVALRDGISVAWTGGGAVDESVLSVTGCFESITTKAQGNAGALHIGPEQLAYLPGCDANQPNPTQLEISLVNEGDADPAYGRGGYLHAAQSRRLSVTVTP